MPRCIKSRSSGYSANLNCKIATAAVSGQHTFTSTFLASELLSHAITFREFWMQCHFFGQWPQTIANTTICDVPPVLPNINYHWKFAYHPDCEANVSVFIDEMVHSKTMVYIPKQQRQTVAWLHSFKCDPLIMWRNTILVTYILWHNQRFRIPWYYLLTPICTEA